MKTERMKCGSCLEILSMDVLEGAEIDHLREHTGVFVAFGDGWQVSATHCPKCHAVVFSVASERGAHPALLWPGRQKIKRERPVQGPFLFRAVWSQLAASGLCDALDGEECNRVLREWIAANEPADVDAFILRAANRLPPDPNNFPVLEVTEEGGGA